MKISVCVPVYNGSQFLESAFACLAKQSCRDFEVVVVDDGSTDGSADLCERLIAEHRLVGKVIRTSNHGCEQARDIACNSATGQLMAPYDCDDIWHERYLEEMSGVLNRNPDVDLVYCDFEEHFVVDQRIERKSQSTPWIDRTLATQTEGDVFIFRNGIFFDMLLQGQVLFPPCTMFRKELHEKVNGYCSLHPDQRISLDWCFGLRATRLGTTAYLDRPLLRKVQQHGENVSGNHLKTAVADMSVLEAILADPTLTQSQRRHAADRAALRASHCAYQQWDENSDPVAAMRWLSVSLRHRWTRRSAVMFAKMLIRAAAGQVRPRKTMATT